jgi:hypothetical protein
VVWPRPLTGHIPLASRLLLIAEAEMIKGLLENYSSESTGLWRACAYAGRSLQPVRPLNDLLLALSHCSAGRERDTSLFLCIDIHRESLVALRRSSIHLPTRRRSSFPAFPARSKPFCPVDQSGLDCITTMGSLPRLLITCACSCSVTS